MKEAPGQPVGGKSPRYWSPGATLLEQLEEDATANQEPVTPATFAQILQRARHGDEEALMMLYQRALPTVYRYVLARLGRPDLAEDVVSEVFLVMVESIRALRTEQEAGFFAWLFQIAQGKCARALRRIQREGQQVPLSGSGTSDDEYTPEPMATDLASNPAAFQEWRETLEELGGALHRLSPEQQMVVVGRFLGGRSAEDLARTLGKHPGAIRILQFRALGALADHLGWARRPRRMGKGGGA
jgi:RNA polymerase sigma-70 factor (ECF subfamily)